LVFSTAADVQLSFIEPVEETLKYSLDAMQTKGEWELVTMQAEKPALRPEELKTSFDVLIYHV